MRGAAVQSSAARGTTHGGIAISGTAVSGKVLIVDDDAGWREILSELLEEAGYQVRACSSYAEAVGHPRREPPPLAVVDLSLLCSPGRARPDRTWMAIACSRRRVTLAWLPSS